MGKIVIILLMLFSFAVSSEKLKISNFSVGYNTGDDSCYVMNDVDAFYVYKLYLDGKVTVYSVLHRNQGTIIKANEIYKNVGIDYVFFTNLETCKIFKDKI